VHGNTCTVKHWIIGLHITPTSFFLSFSLHLSLSSFFFLMVFDLLFSLQFFHTHKTKKELYVQRGTITKVIYPFTLRFGSVPNLVFHSCVVRLLGLGSLRFVQGFELRWFVEFFGLVAIMVWLCASLAVLRY
jgi:hypothetical protein